MGSRLDLQSFLEGLLGSDFVYFQPPPTIQMSYPCIVYRRSRIHSDHADNVPYTLRNEYMVTVIDEDPDSDLPGKVAQLSGVSHDRHFAADGLNHDIFTLFY